MPASVKDARVTKTKTSSSARRKSSRAQSLNTPKHEKKPLPLVERVNLLPCEDFISLYIPPEERALFPTTFTRKGDPQDEATSEKNYKIDIYTAKTIPSVDFEACFRLIEQTQSEAYTRSGLGWSPSKKRKEMKLPDMKYMILRQVSGPPESSTTEKETGASPPDFQGFLSFMVTYEDGIEVIYCYEVHLLPSAQGRGLGELLMRRFAEVGRRVGLEKAMLTVFKSNDRANRLYRRLEYDVDEYSPRPRKLRNGTIVDVDYWIMSLRLKDEGEEGNEDPSDGKLDA